jgi:hypothetical protein
LSTALRTAGRFVSLLHKSRFGQLSLQCFLTRRSYLSATKPFARNGLLLACNSRWISQRPFQGQSSWPATSLTCRLVRLARSVFRLHNPRNGLPRSRLFPCLKPVACRYLPASPAAWSVSTPLRGFSPLWIEAFNECRCLPVHLPNPPDFRSLPEAFSIARCQLRITVPGPLPFRRLAVPQTSWNLPHYDPEIVLRQPLCTIICVRFHSLFIVCFE